MAHFSDLLGLYLQACDTELRPVTVDWYGRMLRPLVGWLDGRGIELASVGDLRTARGELLRDDYSQTTKRDYIRMWRLFFRWLSAEGLIPDDPSVRIRLPSAPALEPSYLLETEVNQLLRWSALNSSARDYALVCFLLSTGARRRGAVGLDVGGVDWLTGRAYVVEKGEKPRTVYLAPLALEALGAYLATRSAVGPSAPLFCSARGGGRLHPDTVSHVVAGLGRGAQLIEALGPHMLRHTFARLYLLNGGDLATLSQLLGHSDVSVTVRFYARFADEELRRKHAQHNPLANGLGVGLGAVRSHVVPVDF